MSQQQPATLRHSFTFGASPDLVGSVGDDAGYVVRHAVNGEERPPEFIQSTHRDTYGFEVDAPEGAVVTILLSARDAFGNASKAVPYEFRATGKRIIRHPGAPAGSLAMVGVRRSVSLTVLPDSPPAGEGEGGCGDGCGCQSAA